MYTEKKKVLIWSTYRLFIVIYCAYDKHHKPDLFLKGTVVSGRHSMQITTKCLLGELQNLKHPYTG